MNLRNSFLSRAGGFSMGGTLGAIAVGGICAALIATLVTRAVDSQRAIIARDEMSEFSHFLRGLLASDAVCNATLADKSFVPGGKTTLTLAVPYQKSKGPITRGFRFAGERLIVDELTIEDRGDSPVPMPVKSGRSMVIMNRYQAKVKLQVRNADGSGYRARFFDVPVLVDAAGAIKACNNEFTVGDACRAIGFEWDTSTNPPSCQPKNACIAGGTYKVITGGVFSDGGCGVANPATGACKCPAGFTDIISGATDIAQFCGRFCMLTFNLIHQCLRCPQ